VYVKGRNKNNTILGKINIDEFNYELSFPTPIFKILNSGDIVKVKFNKDISDDAKVELINNVYDTKNIKDWNLEAKLKIYDNLADYYE
ncbi:hypothetical protein M3M33_14800, partial [Loigolactobacillus coryniformis]|uniref:hypothetical protein n=1 Tax=Loigolactobacillus coryniformis TaxID=1610 RepID=UPI00201A3DA5